MSTIDKLYLFLFLQNKADGMVQNLRTLDQDMFSIKSFSFDELENLKDMKIEDFTAYGFENEFLKKVSDMAEKAMLWKEFDADANVIKSAPFLCKCTLSNEKCIGISLLISDGSNLGNIKKFHALQNDNQLIEKISQMKANHKAGKMGVVVEPSSFFDQTSSYCQQWQKNDLGVLREIKNYFTNKGTIYILGQ